MPKNVLGEEMEPETSPLKRCPKCGVMVTPNVLGEYICKCGEVFK